MTDTEELRVSLANLKTQAEGLRVHMAELGRYIETAQFIPEEAARNVESSLRYCRLEEEHLRSLADGLGIAVGSTHESLLEAVAEHERKCRAEELRDSVKDYFRLTAGVQEVLNALEQTKQTLRAIFHGPDAELETGIGPYRLVADKVRSGEELENDEYDRIRDCMGLDVVRAVDRGRVSIDATLDISVYTGETENPMEAEPRTEENADVAVMPVTEPAPETEEDADAAGSPAAEPEPRTDENADAAIPPVTEPEPQMEVTAEPEVKTAPQDAPAEATEGEESQSADSGATEGEAPQAEPNGAAEGGADSEETTCAETDDTQDTSAEETQQYEPVEKNGEEISEETREPETKATETDPWADFHGLLGDDLKVKKLRDVPASEAKASKFISDVFRRGAAMDTVVELSQIRVIQCGADGNPVRANKYIDKDKLNILRKHGYIADWEIEGRRYASLSSKAYACFVKNDVTRLAKFPSDLYRIFMKDGLSGWSPRFIYTAAIIESYLAAGTVDPSDHVVMRCIDCPDNAFTTVKQPEYAVLPAFFAPDARDKWTGTITGYLKDDESNAAVLVLVADAADIGLLHSVLTREHPEYANRLKYVVRTEPGTVYDGTDKAATPGTAGAAGTQGPVNAPDTETNEAEISAVPEPETAGATGTVTEVQDPPVETEPELPGMQQVSVAPEVTEKPETPAALQNVTEQIDIVIEPEPHKAPVDQFEPDPLCAAQLENARRAFAQGRADVGHVIFAGITGSCPECGPLADKYSYATGDPMRAPDYRPSGVMAVFAGTRGADIETDLLEAAAYLRMFFTQSVAAELYTAGAAGQLQGSRAFSCAPALRDVMFALAGWVREQRRGIDEALLGAALNLSSIEDRVSALGAQAHELLADDKLLKSSHYTDRIKATRAALFGQGSLLRRALRAVETNDVTGAADLWESLKPLLTFDGNVPTAMAGAINDCIDEAWRRNVDKAKRGRNDMLKGCERQTTFNQMKEVLELAGKWLIVAEKTERVSNELTASLKSTLAIVKPRLEQAVSELAPADGLPLPEQAARAVLRDTVKELLDRMNGVFRNPKGFYIDLLREPIVAVDSNFLPYIEEPDEQLKPYGFCERAAKYLELPLREWPEVVRRFFDQDNPRAREFGDYGCARVLREWLAETEPGYQWPDSYDIEKCKKRAIQKENRRADSVYLWEQQFNAQLEMADGDGWFEQADRERIYHIMALRRENCFAMDNYGFYGRTMLRILAHARTQADKLKPDYLERLNKLRAGITEEDTRAAAACDRIKELIDSCRFGAAESYLQQAEAGKFDIEGDRNTVSIFNEFIGKCEMLCRSGSLDQNLVRTYDGWHRNQHNNTINTGRALLEAWPESSARPEKIETVLKSLGLKDVSVTGTMGSARFSAQLKSAEEVRNYPHPIADFGSRLYTDGLQVRLIFGNKTAESLYLEMNAELQKAEHRPLIFLVNCAIRLPERRKLARKFALSVQTTAPCLILDRALLLFLADKPLAERWNTLVYCALPFQPVQMQNPYSENSSAEIPPDMFIGRRDELQQIVLPTGANLIYGGRQLGKTALLQRARTLEHHPEKGSWSAYVEIKHMDSLTAASEIAKALTNQRFFTNKPDIDSWKALADSIEQRLMSESGKTARLLLLIDEADAFLLDCEKHGYRELDSFKRLQNTTGGRFKFVMAGLHNVLRLYNRSLSSNSGVPQLQGLTVKPLSFEDARELLEKPLSCLGFVIPEGQEDIVAQILYNTNYFPGIVHFYASRLVRYMQQNANEGTMPPYLLDREVLTRLLAGEDFRNKRVEKLKMTLGIDSEEHSYYDVLAHLLCYCCNESEEARQYGMTAKELLDEAKALEPQSRVAQLDEKQMAALLDELCDLNILRREKDADAGEGSGAWYMFSRSSFMEMLGTKEEVQNHLIEVIGK